MAPIYSPCGLQPARPRSSTGSSVVVGVRRSHRGFADGVQPTVPDTAVPHCVLVRSVKSRTLIQSRGALRHGSLPVSKCPLCSCFLTAGVHQKPTPACSYFVLTSPVAPFRNTPCRNYFRPACQASSSYVPRLPVQSTLDGSVESRAHSSPTEPGVTAMDPAQCPCRKPAQTSSRPARRRRALSLSYWKTGELG